ncbi:SDR family NAD(P)-dependent oxidoreductase [Nocardioides sp. LHD-245]|uniref:SDR family NAD(P)-dependent oxidoreductase n=1 Tax=Nocardioides sp. LHD-245 TaxID=3051387 RepID=UPI0027DFFFE9|nr:SDR family NAD(P)-dependent oxidoreductase [Nocardioides sp. LHD-245]
MARWFITGASRGLGRAIALAALQAGHEVAATMRDPAAAAPELLASSGAEVIALDVRDADQVRQAVAGATERFGGIDVLVNNAGRGLLGAIESTTAEEVRALYEVNVFGLLTVSRAVLPVMRATGRGHIINIGSMGGIAAFAGTGVYASTKFAVAGLTEAMRDELAHTALRVSVVEPGSFRTDFMDPASMSVASGPRFPEYGPSVDDMTSRHLATNHTQAGDPARAAQAVLRLAESPDPPTHLVLGADAVARAEAKLRSLGAELEAWRETSLGTGYGEPT